MPLHKKNHPPKTLRARNFVYDLVEDTETTKDKNMEVILTAFVDGVGDRGDVVSVKPNTAYYKLLLPGLAVYKTEENQEKYARKESDTQETKHSSPHAQRCVNLLQTMVFQISMNKYNPWVLEKWHVRAALRRAGFHILDEKCIELPQKAITGPNLDIQGKEFFVTVTINNLEKARVRCRIHHWSSDPDDRIPWVFEHWKLRAEPIFPEDAATTTPTTSTTPAQPTA